MPNIEINLKDLQHLIPKLVLSDIEKATEYMKIGIEGAEGDTLTLEVKDSNRPDLLSAEGIARELKGVLKKEKGLAKYSAKKSDYKMNVSPSVKKVRPEIAAAVIKNVSLDDSAIKQLIQLQEKLCEGFGRKRKEAALGVYDFDKIKWPIEYRTFKDDEIKFVPLGMTRSLSPLQILEHHEKGKEYASLIKGDDFPFIIDAGKNVLSMPPVINSDYSGKVTEHTKNLFIEVTGMNHEKILLVLNIVVAALADRKGEVYSVEINGSRRVSTPYFPVRKKTVNVSEVNERLGLSLNSKEIVSLLEKYRYGAKAKKDDIEVEIPFYRADILHPVDIIEDIAIAYGYSNFKVEEPQIATVGSLSDETKRAYKISDLMVGLGFQDVETLTLTNKEALFKMMNSQPSAVVEIENPVSKTYSIMRSSILPSLMAALEMNKKSEYPQKMFEVGKTVEVNERSETKSDTLHKLCIVLADKAANFTQAKEILQYILKGLGHAEISVTESKNPSFIEGRCGEVFIGKKSIGILGEIHPAVLSNFGLKMPVASFEIYLDRI